MKPYKSRLVKKYVFTNLDSWYIWLPKVCNIFITRIHVTLLFLFNNSNILILRRKKKPNIYLQYFDFTIFYLQKEYMIWISNLKILGIFLMNTQKNKSLLVMIWNYLCLDPSYKRWDDVWKNNRWFVWKAKIQRILG